MPYIPQQTREDLNNGGVPRTAGDLNYTLSCIVLQYLEDNGEMYATYNDILGALEGAKLELYRRRVAPYEDKALLRNGDL